MLSVANEVLRKLNMLPMISKGPYIYSSDGNHFLAEVWVFAPGRYCWDITPFECEFFSTAKELARKLPKKGCLVVWNMVIPAALAAFFAAATIPNTVQRLVAEHAKHTLLVTQ